MGISVVRSLLLRGKAQPQPSSASSGAPSSVLSGASSSEAEHNLSFSTILPLGAPSSASSGAPLSVSSGASSSEEERNLSFSTILPLEKNESPPQEPLPQRQSTTSA